VKARVNVASDFGRLPSAIETAVYRVVQEALHNVARHANASNVLIELSRDDGDVRLTVEDDGVGIIAKPNPARQTFGVSGMRERIATLGGKMNIVSSRGKGTRIEISVPIMAGLNEAAGPAVAKIDPDAMAQGA